jgi:hypothetical protein
LPQVEKREQFARLIARGLITPRHAGSPGSAGGPGNGGDTAARSRPGTAGSCIILPGFMSTGIIMVIVVAVIVVAALVTDVMAIMRRRRLQRRFGPEYPARLSMRGGHRGVAWLCCSRPW